MKAASLAARANNVLAGPRARHPFMLCCLCPIFLLFFFAHSIQIQIDNRCTCARCQLLRDGDALKIASNEHLNSVRIVDRPLEHFVHQQLNRTHVSNQKSCCYRMLVWVCGICNIIVNFLQLFKTPVFDNKVGIKG